MKNVLEGKRIALVTASASRLGGGVAEAVLAQAKLICELGGIPHVFALKDQLSEESRGRFGAIKLDFLPISGPAMVGFAPRLNAALLACEADLLHLHGIWQYPSHAAALWGRRSGNPVLISPHGMLDPWITQRGRWKKALARLGYERASWRQAATFHALTGNEAQDIIRETGRSNILTIPNPAPDTSGLPAAMRAPHILFLGRIHPKKNLATLIDAWDILAAQRKLGQAKLTIAGWGKADDVAALQARIAKATPSVRFVGPVEGAEKQALLNTARFQILPTHSEGLPMSILEGWAAGTPSIMTRHCHLPEGFAKGAAIECGVSAEEIAKAICAALTLGESEWLPMTRAAHELAKGKFARAAVAQSWKIAYSKLMHQSPGTHGA